MEFLSYAIAIIRNVYKPKELQMPAPQEPASQDDWGDDDPAPELKLNPKWLRTLNTSKPGGERMNADCQYKRSRTLCSEAKSSHTPANI